ncbi:tyrosyl-DNA phosphodiesterase domain-containing protein [Phthorimaea operculella]|nr:tyrosyl-DNA phosphodiesterase domain-containing protein [Phthorimaea operculella]
MNTATKRKDAMDDNKSPKRMKKECSYGEKCYRLNPAHFREFSHPHLESIIDAKPDDGDYPIPDHLSLNKFQIKEQIGVIMDKQLYVPKKIGQTSSTKPQNEQPSQSIPDSRHTSSSTSNDKTTATSSRENLSVQSRDKSKSPVDKKKGESVSSTTGNDKLMSNKNYSSSSQNKTVQSSTKTKGPDYVPIVPPVRRAEEYLKVVNPRGKMADKHKNSAPYHIFYTTITDARETHSQPYSVTFMELLDSSLGELKCSLQINFMVDATWLLAQYYFTGYSQKKLTILYEEDCSGDLRSISQKKPHVDAHKVIMATPFGKHHTKMMILCYEDGSLRVVVSTANLYPDDWENRTQGLWLSPACPELPTDAMPHDGDSPTGFKKTLLKYLHHYNMPQLSYYIERVKRCDFSHINVFLVASVPGGHFDMEWGMTRIGTLLRQHCQIPQSEQRAWPLIAQASSIGSYGKDPKLWLTGDFLHHFTKIKNQPQMLTQPPELKVIYPSLENVRQSHDGLLGGGCLPYAADAHSKQPWLNNFLFQWRAKHTCRDRAMPHIKSYTRVNKNADLAAFYLLTSANISKAAWGNINKGNAALRIMSYEAGVLFLPTFVLKEDFFPLSPGHKNRLVIPYDLPPTRYSPDMSPWVQDYLRS